MTLAISLHLLSAVIWVGGMFFAYMALRPAAAGVLDPPRRLSLWSHTLARFFPWVWLSIILLPLTGYWMIFRHFGGMAHVGVSIHIMQALGILMILIFLHVFFAPFRRLRRAVDAGDTPGAGRQLTRIRWLVLTNLLLGIIVTVIGAAGPFLAV